MPLQDPLDYIDAWPDESDWFICRFNQAYVKVLEGLVVPLFLESQWQGTPAQTAEMAAKARVLWQQVITPYSPPAGEEGSMQNVIAAYQVAASTNGATLTLNTWTQVPYNTLLLDDTGEAVLNGNGTIILPSGNWIASINQNASHTAELRGNLRITDGVSVDIATGLVRLAYAAWLPLNIPISSDGETPIEIRLYLSVSGRFGSYYQTDVGSIYGTARFTRPTPE